jgi:hypothetical protein
MLNLIDMGAYLSEIFLNHISKSNKEVAFCFSKFFELLKNDDY